MGTESLEGLDGVWCCKGSFSREHATEFTLPGRGSLIMDCQEVLILQEPFWKREFIPLESRSIIENGRAYCGRGGGLLAVELEVSVGIGRWNEECIIKSRVHGALQMASEGIYLRKGNQSDAASFIEGIDDYSRARTEKEHRETLHA
ncbi:hypothetical protein B0H16DRAFT_1459598 [Mycena metata]|uniref:Uncharacterized protein n=1 Tax=Mycena metata TaxID=1033252 RepID=A0AAD7J140_9AGAR|nr:hypothetical protein B0H16DRAFT_1459598 [Mycena metata]